MQDNYWPDDVTNHYPANKTLFADPAVYEDVRIQLGAVKPGVNAPTWGPSGFDAALYCWLFSDAAVNEEEVHFAVQIPHAFLEGSTIYPHVHWHPKQAPAADNRVVRWGFRYSWGNIDAIMPGGVTINADSENLMIAGSQNKHILTSFPAIVGGGKTISSMLLCWLFRNSSHANDTYTGDAGFLEFDIHVQLNSFGSRQELIK